MDVRSECCQVEFSRKRKLRFFNEIIVAIAKIRKMISGRRKKIAVVIIHMLADCFGSSSDKLQEGHGVARNLSTSKISTIKSAATR